jgi:hypothetical protein
VSRLAAPQRHLERALLGFPPATAPLDHARLRLRLARLADAAANAAVRGGGGAAAGVGHWWGAVQVEFSSTHSLKSPGFNPCVYQVKKLVSKFAAFKSNVYRYTLGSRHRAAAGRGGGFPARTPGGNSSHRCNCRHRYDCTG